MGRINLEEILDQNTGNEFIKYKQEVLQAMKEACEQVLDIAAEEAEVTNKV